MGKVAVLVISAVCALGLIVHTRDTIVDDSKENEIVVDTPPSENNTTIVVDEPEEVEYDTTIDEELESERQLKRMLTYVTPLMAILRSQPKSRQSRSENSRNYDRGYYDRNPNRDGGYDDYERNSGHDRNYDRNSIQDRNYDRYYERPYDRYSYDRSPYSDNNNDRNGYGGGYGGGYCCNQKDDLLPLLALLGLAGLLLYLVLIASTTTTAAGRRRRFAEDDNDDNEVDMTDYDNIVLLDGPTWLSMVHELWEQDAALENTACTQETLCRMNRLAMAAPGQAGWAVSLSSLPLSYLLHTRHTGGFSSFMDAALMGRSGANCTELYKSCPRLSY